MVAWWASNAKFQYMPSQRCGVTTKASARPWLPPTRHANLQCYSFPALASLKHTHKSCIPMGNLAPQTRHGNTDDPDDKQQ
ncbi:MAG: hypothetical protein ACI8PT_003140 [Gammaproteobacteria bacterium]|jgi:hypothetical protein